MSVSLTPMRGSLASRLFPAGLIAAVIGFGLYFDHEASTAAPPPDTVAASASPQVRELAQQVVASRDHAGQPFVVVDAAQERVYAFDPQGRLRVSAHVEPSAAGDTAIPADVWSECVSSLHAEPAVAYVLPREESRPANASVPPARLAQRRPS